MTAVAIEAVGLHAGYDGNTVVRDLDLHVAPGEVVALLGPNGAGKTTTLMTIAGVLSPIAGEVRQAGFPTHAPLHRRVRQGLGLVTEQRAVLMRLTVRQNLAVAGDLRERAMTLFPELKEHLDRKVGDLSGGQQQIVALARALAQEPHVLLADELSLGLAPLVVDRLLRAVRDAADRGVGVLVVEQHVAKVLPLADRVIVMRRGRVLHEGPAREAVSKLDELQESYFA